MDVRRALALAAVTAVAAAAPVEAVRYLESRRTAAGAFAEADGAPTPQLTAWAVLALASAGRQPVAETERYLVESLSRLTAATDVELVAAALCAGGRRSDAAVARVRALVRPDGAIGPTVNSTAWGVLALRQCGAQPPVQTTRWLLARQHRSGGWSWAPRGAPDTNDTAAVVQALRAVGSRGKPIARALAFLRRHQNRDGGFELAEGRGSDVQSTAWAVQAFLAARAPAPRGAYAYLARMQRVDGSYRYSARYAVTPVWVTAQALPAVTRKPFPLR